MGVLGSNRRWGVWRTPCFWLGSACWSIWWVRLRATPVFPRNGWSWENATAADSLRPRRWDAPDCRFFRLRRPSTGCPLLRGSASWTPRAGCCNSTAGYPQTRWSSPFRRRSSPGSNRNCRILLKPHRFSLAPLSKTTSSRCFPSCSATERYGGSSNPRDQ